MRPLWKAALPVAIVVTLLPVALAAQWARGSTGIILYEDAGHRGRSATTTRDVADLRTIGMDDRISSVATARGEVWELCEDRNYRGRCVEVSGAEADLRQHNFQDRASSVRRVERGTGFGGWRPIGRPQIILYDETNYRGRSMTVDDATAALGLFANRTASVQVVRGRWELCDQTKFSGRCIVVSGNVRDLASVAFRDRLSSLRPR